MNAPPLKRKESSRKNKRNESRRSESRPNVNKKPEFEVGSSKSSGSNGTTLNGRKRKSPTPPLPYGTPTNRRDMPENHSFEQGNDFIPFSTSDKSSSENEDAEYDRRDSRNGRSDSGKRSDWEKEIDGARRDRDREWEDERRRPGRHSSPRPGDKRKS
jgi:hypothetical protein